MRRTARPPRGTRRVALEMPLSAAELLGAAIRLLQQPQEARRLHVYGAVLLAPAVAFASRCGIACLEPSSSTAPAVASKVRLACASRFRSEGFLDCATGARSEWNLDCASRARSQCGSGMLPNPSGSGSCECYTRITTPRRRELVNRIGTCNAPHLSSHFRARAPQPVDLGHPAIPLKNGGGGRPRKGTEKFIYVHTYLNRPDLCTD